MPEKFKFPIPCVRLIALDGHGRLLILRRASGTFRGGGWTLPGGKIDYGESPDAAARRELLEETALEASDLRHLFWQDSPPVEPGSMHAITFYYECRVGGALALNRESEDKRWVTPDEALALDLEFRGGDGLRQWMAGRGSGA